MQMEIGMPRLGYSICEKCGSSPSGGAWLAGPAPSGPAPAAQSACPLRQSATQAESSHQWRFCCDLLSSHMQFTCDQRY